MKKLIFRTVTFALAMICIMGKSFSQTDYYWYKNQKVILEMIANKKYLVVEEVNDSIELRQKLNLLDNMTVN